VKARSLTGPDAEYPTLDTALVGEGRIGVATVRARALPAQSFLGEASEGAVEAPSD
jgi:hypothetical protein